MPITRERILEIARSLPPAPRVFSELDQVLRESETRRGLEDVAALIKGDAAMAAQLLRVSNSVVYGGEQRIGSIEEAVARVGLQEIFRIVSEVAVARLADRALTHYGVEADTLREHMLRSAFVCEQLAVEGGIDSRMAYTAGLMRPLGLLVLDRVADRYRDTQDYHPTGDGDYLTWEGRVFGIASCDVAAMVLSEWSFPAPIIEAVQNQYLLRSSDLAHPLACLVNLAGGVVADDGVGLLGEAKHWGPTPWKLEAVGLDQARFETAVARARVAYEEFRRRLRGERSAVAPVAAPVRAPAPATPEAAAEMPRAPEVDSCNFPDRVRVVQANDEPPVHTTEAGVSPATDFTTFMRNYQDMVFSTAARLTGNDAQAEDIAQEVFLKAYENYSHLSTSPTAGGWLKTVATNLSLNHLSRYRNRWRFFSEFKTEAQAEDRDAPEVEFAAPDTFFAGMDASDRRALVEDALSQLPEHQRVPLVLYHFEDLPYEEIAKKLRVSLAKVKTDILRARAALAKILARTGTPHEKIVP